MKESVISSRLEPAVPAGHLSVKAAAVRLGLDPFTVYSFIQRDRLSPILDDEGIFVVSEEEVNRLAKGKKEWSAMLKKGGKLWIPRGPRGSGSDLVGDEVLAFPRSI
jgi:hypothetical protein